MNLEASSTRYGAAWDSSWNIGQSEPISFRENIDTAGPLGRAIVVIYGCSGHQLSNPGYNKGAPKSRFVPQNHRLDLIDLAVPKGIA